MGWGNTTGETHGDDNLGRHFGKTDWQTLGQAANILVAEYQNAAGRPVTLVDRK